MLPNLVALHGHDVAAGFSLRCRALQNAAITAPFDEADVLRLCLVMDGQPQSRRVSARLCLRELAERQQERGQ